MMRAARVAIGVTLIAVGTASAISAARTVMGDAARAQAAVMAAETLRAQEQAAQQTRAEQAVVGPQPGRPTVRAASGPGRQPSRWRCAEWD